ncbi:MAG: hypothetical protein ACI86M_002170 [Saprospiraceae bacterium]|jgi:hypothetical protein
MDSKISITRVVLEQFSSFSTSQIYEMKQDGEDGFTFTFHVSAHNILVSTDSLTSILEPIESFTRFENIILTRK